MLDAKPKYVVSLARADYSWSNTHHLTGDLRQEVEKLKEANEADVLVASCMLAAGFDRFELIDEYKLLVQPRFAGHGPTLYESGLPSARCLDLISAAPFSNGVIATHYRRAR